jgi:hypothetical protein
LYVFIQVETVERLQRRVRDYRANYKQSLSVLEHAKKCTTDGNGKGLVTKTSLMLGLGENETDIEQALKDIRSAGVDVLTFGQYLRPSPRHISVQVILTIFMSQTLLNIFPFVALFGAIRIRTLERACIVPWIQVRSVRTIGALLLQSSRALPQGDAHRGQSLS